MAPEPTTTTTTIPPGNTAIFEVSSNPKMVSMPTLTGGNTNGASSKARKAGLKLRRVERAEARRAAGDRAGPVAGAGVQGARAAPT